MFIATEETRFQIPKGFHVKTINCDIMNSLKKIAGLLWIAVAVAAQLLQTKGEH